MAQLNEFIIEVMEDGKIKATAPGSFNATVHKDADDFLDYLHSLTGGEQIIKKLAPSLGNPQAAKKQQKHKH